MTSPPACCTATHRSFAQAAPSPSGSLNAVSLQRWHARLGQGDDVLPYVNRVTKYDPADRDQRGSYTGTESAVSDQGPVEAAYLEAVIAFAEDAGVGWLAARAWPAPWSASPSRHGTRRSWSTTR
ncbi:hypothetical protein ACIOTI_38790 [Streptomyces sp. NPDC087843]|uniref:hypothetical protein n=1 Tax=Streptomyces sp. NPDC087843 TaxID=3365804 RepID=UPI00381751B2